ncbi:MAG: hypothetical protein ACOC3S_01020 [Bacteroidota bacterium]
MLINILYLSTNLAGQPSDTTSMVKYHADFKFKNGIFLSFTDLKENAPVPPSRIATTLDHDNRDFYERLFKDEKIYFFNILGQKVEVKTKNIWGFSRNGIIHVQVGDGFTRLTYIGSISHFVADITTYQTQYNPYHNPYYYSGRNTYGYYPSTQKNTDLRQFILDFETGRILEYNHENIAVLLMKDPELHDEYMALRKRKKKQLMFYYIRKFNERNPLYLPDK